MNKNVLIAVMVVAVTALGIVVVRQHGEIAELKKAAELPTAPMHVAAAKPVAVASPSEPSEPAPEPVAPTTPPRPPAPEAQASTSTGRTNNFFAGLANMMKNPQMKEMVRAQQKVMLDRQYGSLSKYLNLPAERSDALKELLSDRQMAMVDAGMSMMSGSDTDRKQAVEETKAIKAEYDKKIQELLGPQDYQAFQDYEKTVNERMSVQMFKDALPATDALSDQQEDSLIAAMYQERKTLPASSLMNNQNQDPSQLTEERIAELQKQMEELQKLYADRAAAILTPPQLEQFSKWQQQYSTMQLAGLKMAAAMFGNKSLSQPPAGNSSQTP